METTVNNPILSNLSDVIDELVNRISRLQADGHIDLEAEEQLYGCVEGFVSIQAALVKQRQLDRLITNYKPNPEKIT